MGVLEFYSSPLIVTGLEFSCMIFSAMVIISTLFTAGAAPEQQKYLLWLFFCNVLMLVCHSFSGLQPDLENIFSVTLGDLFNSVYYITLFLLLAFFTSYILTVVKVAPQAMRTLRFSVWLCCLIVILLMIGIQAFTMFGVPLGNSESKFPYRVVSSVYALLVSVVDLLFLALHRKQARTADLIIFSICIVINMVSMIGEFFVPSLSPMVFSFTATLTVLFLRHQRLLALQYIQRERELTDSRTKLMLSQIRPHFLFNSLTSIMCLCKTDPDKAGESLFDFSEYLRGNMSVLTAVKPIPFETELNHIRHYLKLEQLRFGEKLTVTYDIEYTDFCIPQLSVQPLVENAVKHGVGMKKTGGTVRLSCRKVENTVLITVTDDGIGFDLKEPTDTVRPHVGIENVRTRLSDYNASLEVFSTIGEGTVAAITIENAPPASAWTAPDTESVNKILKGRNKLEHNRNR